jgi:superfamily II DNA or RNA helicase
MTCILKIHNDHTYIDGVFPRDEVDKAVSYFRSGFYMSERYRLCPKCKQKIIQKTGRCCKCGTPRAWDGRTRLMLGGKKTSYIPTGCLPIALDVLHRYGFKPSFEDLRGEPTTPPAEEAYKLILRDPDDPNKERIPWPHQQNAIEAALSYHRGIIHIPTSGGKTVVMAALAKLLACTGIILINKITLAAQIRREVSGMLGEPVGFIGSGIFEPQRINVCMTQTLAGAVGLINDQPINQEIAQIIKNCKLLILDEAHHSSSNTWYKLTKYCQNAYYRFGLTGTPFMRSAGDDILLVASTGPLIYEVEEQELIRQGLIAQPIIHFYRIDKPINLTDEMSYQDVYQLGVVSNEQLNKIALENIKALAQQGAQILVLAEHIEHIDSISKGLGKTEHEVLTGTSSQAQRQINIDRFQRGDLQVILASNIFDEGISLHNIDVVIRLGLLKTSIKSKQQVGRGQRNKKNKKQNVVHIIDFYHTTHKYLQEHSQAHFDTYVSLKYPIVHETETLKDID